MFPKQAEQGCSFPAGTSGPDRPENLPFKNNTEQTVEIVWVDVECAEVPIANVRRGESVTINTWSQHAFRVRLDGAIAKTVRPGIARALQIVAPLQNVSLVPGRLFDSRPGFVTVDSVGSGGGLLAAGVSTEIQIAGRGGVAPGADAVVMNVTAVQPLGSGFITVYPCGSSLPNSASLNFVAGAIVPNAVISKLGPTGKVCVYTTVPTHLVVDVNGYYPEI
jgi:hypothetical protein